MKILELSRGELSILRRALRDFIKTSTFELNIREAEAVDGLYKKILKPVPRRADTATQPAPGG